MEIQKTMKRNFYLLYIEINNVILYNNSITLSKVCIIANYIDCNIFIKGFLRRNNEEGKFK